MIDSQISNVQNTSDVICNWIIQVLSYTCKYYNISYGELNMLLLCIDILLIMLYSTGALFNNKLILRITLICTIVSFVGIIILFGMVPVPNNLF